MLVAMENNLKSNLVDLQREIEKIPEIQGNATDRHTKVLVKVDDFKLVMISLNKGAHIHEHKAPGRILVQTLKGHIQFKLPTETLEMPKGSLITVEPHVPHDVTALENSVFLLSIFTPVNKTE
jgi:quercetin dioxygenase-like cupin family protein